jgi:hypothetical protein
LFDRFECFCTTRTARRDREGSAGHLYRGRTRGRCDFPESIIKLSQFVDIDTDQGIQLD